MRDDLSRSKAVVFSALCHDLQVRQLISLADGGFVAVAREVIQPFSVVSFCVSSRIPDLLRCERMISSNDHHASRGTAAPLSMQMHIGYFPGPIDWPKCIHLLLDSIVVQRQSISYWGWILVRHARLAGRLTSKLPPPAHDPAPLSAHGLQLQLQLWLRVSQRHCVPRTPWLLGSHLVSFLVNHSLLRRRVAPPLMASGRRHHLGSHRLVPGLFADPLDSRASQSRTEHRGAVSKVLNSSRHARIIGATLLDRMHHSKLQTPMNRDTKNTIHVSSSKNHLAHCFS